MSRIHNKNHLRGFTLLETMVVVVVIGLIAGMTIPAISDYMAHQRVQGATNELMADIQYARSIAIAQQRTFQITFEADSYAVVNPATGVAVRTREAPPGVTFTADQDPNFFAWGLTDAAAISIEGCDLDNAVNLMPNGTVTHYAQ